MSEHQWIRHCSSGNYGLLPIFILLAGLMMACSQGNLGTRSVRTTNQSPPSNEQHPSSDEIFTVVEHQPEFPGGVAQLGAYMRQNLRYPEAAKRANVQGRAFVSFIVTKEGDITGVQVLKGLGFGTNEEAQRLVQSMPRWRPGKQSGQPVNVKYNLVVHFDLSGQN